MSDTTDFTKLNSTKERFSFREMEYIVVNYLIHYQKGYTDSFRDYYKNVKVDWREWLKQEDNKRK